MQQEDLQWKEILAIEALQSIGGRDVTKYLPCYVRNMGVIHILDAEMVDIFEIAVVSKIDNWMKELKTS